VRAVAAAVLLAACDQPRLSLAPADRPPAPAVYAGLEHAARGAFAAVAVRAVAADGSLLLGVQGTVVFDPTRLWYVGQVVDDGVIVLVNAEAETTGRVRLAALRPGGLPARAAVLVFAVRDPAYAASLRFEYEAAATAAVREPSSVIVEPAVAASDLAVPGDARHLTLADWYEVLDPVLARAERERPARSPGEYRLNLRYGDATLNGSVNILDAAALSNLAVGNLPLLTDSTRDYVIAGNVYPANQPGLGEDGDALPPGRNPDGSYSLNVLDAAAVSNESIGYDQPIVGELIPGRGPRPSARVVFSGTLATDRVLTPDTVWELQGTVNVPGGVTLTILPGTILEGDDDTRGALVVRRGGNLIARGTRLEPIVFTCAAPVRVPGCWGGVAINGFSLLNNGEILPGGVDVNGCPQKVAPTGGYFGGCLVQDTSGVLRYVRIEYAGMAPAGSAPAAGLALLGVGTGTVVDSIQVIESRGPGLLLAGGTVDIRSVVLTHNEASGLRYEDGWVGRGQFLIVHQGSADGPGLLGINFPLNPGAGPRSNPSLYNLSVVGPSSGGTAQGLRFQDGAAGTVRNAVVLAPGAAGLDVDGAEACQQAAGAAPGLVVAASIFSGGSPDFEADADCLDETAYATAPALANRVTDPELIAPQLTRTPDYRPRPASAAASGGATPPANGFFDVTATYVGAVAPADASQARVPWYAGWTRGW
jgi:hypothetical protein